MWIKCPEFRSWCKILDDPQVELLLIRSCLSVCKINHLLRTVSSEIIENQLDVLNDGLRSALSSTVKAAVSEYVWLQANLPYRLGRLHEFEGGKAVDFSCIFSLETSNLSGALSSSFPGEESAFQLTLSLLCGKVNLVDL